MNFRLTQFCILNKMSKRFRFRFRYLLGLENLIHQNLKFKAIKLCDFKLDRIKWQLNFVSCNFGLKSYLWFQIELALRARSILKSRVWFQTKLHSTQFNYQYKLSFVQFEGMGCVYYVRERLWLMNLGFVLLGIAHKPSGVC